jgi:hypothetical protein
VCEDEQALELHVSGHATRFADRRVPLAPRVVSVGAQRRRRKGMQTVLSHRVKSKHS